MEHNLLMGNLKHNWRIILILILGLFLGLFVFSLGEIARAQEAASVDFYYTGEGTRLGKKLDDQNYTVYFNPYILKEVREGKVFWRKSYRAGGKTVAIREVTEQGGASKEESSVAQNTNQGRGLKGKKPKETRNFQLIAGIGQIMSDYFDWLGVSLHNIGYRLEDTFMVGEHRIALSLESAGQALSDVFQAQEEEEEGGGSDSTYVQYMPVPSVSNFSTSPFRASAQISYPIETPPGPGGISPSLSLSYSSSQVDRLMQFVPTSKKERFIRQSGPLGLGWGISGGNYSIFLDTHNELDDTDKWTYRINFPGGSAELIKENGKWKTDPELFVKFIEVKAGNEGGRWKIKTPDGTTYVFGDPEGDIDPDDTDSVETILRPWVCCSGEWPPVEGDDWRGRRTAVSWKLTQVISPFEQTINYDYKDFEGKVCRGGYHIARECWDYAGRSVIKKISYGPNEIQFVYGKDREDWRIVKESDFEEDDGDYVFRNLDDFDDNDNAVAHLTDKALSEIKIKVGGDTMDTVRTYELEYYDDFTVTDEFIETGGIQPKTFAVKSFVTNGDHCSSAADCADPCKPKASMRCNPAVDKKECGSPRKGCEMYCDASKHLEWKDDYSACQCESGYEWDGSTCVPEEPQGCNAQCEGEGYVSGWCTKWYHCTAPRLHQLGWGHDHGCCDPFTDEDCFDPLCCCVERELPQGYHKYGYYTVNDDPAEQIRSYHLTLKSITEIGEDGSTSFPSHSFTYQKVPFRVWYDEAGTECGEGCASNSVYIKTADNGYQGKVRYYFEDLQQPTQICYEDGTCVVDSKNRNDKYQGDKQRFSLQRAKLEKTRTWNGQGEWWDTVYRYPEQEWGLGYMEQEPKGFQFLGYSSVEQHQGKKNLDLYSSGISGRTTLSQSRTFFHQGLGAEGCFRKDPRAGLAYKTWTIKGIIDRTEEGEWEMVKENVLSETLKNYVFSDQDGDLLTTADQNQCQDWKEGQTPLLVETKNSDINGGSWPFIGVDIDLDQNIWSNYCNSGICGMTKTERGYDWRFDKTPTWNRDHNRFAAVIRRVNYGDISRTGDETTRCTTYCADGLSWRLNKRDKTWILDGEQNCDSTALKYNLTEYYYGNRNNAKGCANKLPASEFNWGPVTAVKSTEQQSQESFKTERKYNPNYGTLCKSVDAKGNVSWTTKCQNPDDANSASQACKKCSSGNPFDGVYTTKSVNALGQETVTDYDFKMGVPTEVTDPNGTATEYAYDALGRLQKVAKPGDSLASPTSTFSYHINNTVGTENAPMAVYKRVKAAEKEPLNSSPGSELIIRAKADEFEGWPFMKVYINGSLTVGDVVDTDTYADYAFPLYEEIGDVDISKIAIVFDNDHYEGIGKDRNLYIDYISINGVEFQTENPGVSYDRDNAFDGIDVIPGQEGMYWNGGLHFYFDREFLESYDFYNGVGQKFETQSLEPDGEALTSMKEFDALGRNHITYLPFKQGDFGKAYFEGRRMMDGRPLPPFPPPGPEGSTQIEFDSKGRTVKTTAPDGRETRNYYKESEFASASVDSEGRTTVTKTDGLDRTTESIDCRNHNPADPFACEGLTTSYTYDPLGNTETVTDSAGVTVTENSFDTLGRKQWTEDQDLGRYEYDYDKNGNLTWQKDPQGNETAFEYDALDRRTSKEFRGQETLSYTYDDCQNGKGRKCAFEDQYQTTTFEYDLRGRLQSKTRNFKSGTELSALLDGVSSFTTNYEYDNLDRRTELTLPGIEDLDQETIHYEYQGPYLKNVSGKDTYVSDLNYNVFGQVTRRELGSGAEERFTYNTLNQRLETIDVDAAGNKILDLEYDEYSDAGNIKSIEDRTPYPADLTDKLSMSQDFAYDNFYRLVSASGPYSANYTYDDLDRMTEKTVEGATTNFGVSNTFPYHGVKEVDTNEVSYDQAGNITSYQIGGNVRQINWNYSIGKPDRIELSLKEETEYPTIDSFNATWSEQEEGTEVSWQVSDTGGSHLDRVEVWRKKDFGAANWEKTSTHNVPSDTDSWSDSMIDSNPERTAFRYGIHVFDQAGNQTTEDSPILVIPPPTPPPTEPEALKGDLNGDQKVNGKDMDVLFDNLGPCPEGTEADFDQSGRVDAHDIWQLRQYIKEFQESQ